MIHEKLKNLLNELSALPAETEWVEFKSARANFSFKELGQYFSALSNEANLKNKEYGWLIFGVEDKSRKIVGTSYRHNRADLDSLKTEIANKTTNRITFIEIHELSLSEGRVIIFQIPPASQGIPVAWEGHYYGRDGESIGALNVQEFEQIRNQVQRIDWSAQLCRLLLDKLPDILTEKQKRTRVKNLLFEMANKDKSIVNGGTNRSPKWTLA